MVIPSGHHEVLSVNLLTLISHSRFEVSLILHRITSTKTARFMKQFLSRFSNALSLLFCVLFATTVVTAQTNPTPQGMPYTQNFSGYTGSTTTYLAGWQGWTIGTISTAFITAAPTANQTQAAGTNASTGAGVYDFNQKIGMLSTATANTGGKAICLSISTTGYTNVQISYLAGTQRTQSTDRVGALGLQYRIGNTGSFTDVGTAYQNINTTAEDFYHNLLKMNIERK